MKALFTVRTFYLVQLLLRPSPSFGDVGSDKELIEEAQSFTLEGDDNDDDYAQCSNDGHCERRLSTLPNVNDLYHKDYDLDSGQISGAVTWTAPSIVTEITSYRIYLARDSTGTSQASLGVVPVGTNTYNIAADTTLAGVYTHILVRPQSSLGTSTLSSAFAICDVSNLDSVQIINEIATTSNWAILELKFYATPDCSGVAMVGAISSSTGDSTGYEHGKAFDDNTATHWASSCSNCAKGLAGVGLVGVCDVEEVRCVKMRQCRPADCSEAAHQRITKVALQVKGAVVTRWKVLPTNDFGNLLTDEHLYVHGRRRRGTVAVMSEVANASYAATKTQFTR